MSFEIVPSEGNRSGLLTPVQWQPADLVLHPDQRWLQLQRPGQDRFGIVGAGNVRDIHPAPPPLPLDEATDLFLRNNKSPSRKVNEPDNRASHFYLALYWAQALAEQDEDPEVKAAFSSIASELAAQEETIANELLEVQGEPVDLGGYYLPDEEKVTALMRPSPTFNAIIASLG